MVVIDRIIKLYTKALPGIVGSAFVLPKGQEKSPGELGEIKVNPPSGIAGGSKGFSGK